MENKEIDIVQLEKIFKIALLQVKKIKNENDKYSLLIEKEYESYNLFFIKSYLEMFKSEVTDECIDTQLEKLKMLWTHAQRVFNEYSTSELK
jgi:hypothetical protein